MRNVLLYGTAAIGVSVALACGGAAPTDAAANVFQIAKIVVAPVTVACTPGYGYQLRFNVSLVNTTGADITVTKVRSSGVIVRTGSNVGVGQYLNVRDSIEVEPITLLANDGSGTKILPVTLDSQCGTYPSNPRTQVCENGFCHFVGGETSGYVDMQTTLWVRTTSGEYQATPVNSRINYR